MDEGKRATSKNSAQDERSGEPTASPSKDIKSRPVQILVSPRKLGNIAPMATDTILNALTAYPDVRIVKRIRPTAFGALTAGNGTQDDVLVAETTAERADILQRSAGNAVIVERNARLQHFGFPARIVPSGVGLPGFSLSSVAVRFKITAPDGAGIEGAELFVYTGGFPVTVLTDAAGEASATIPQSAIDFLYVKPKADYWEKWLERPALELNSVNVIALQPLSAFAPAGFPADPFFGWGEKMMGLDEKQLTGKGAKIGIIDSGCDNRHPALTHVVSGADYTSLDAQGNPDTTTWSFDEISHGTHCAGVICGNGKKGIRGFAPGAEAHALKLFPGGRFDSLISAIKYAIDHQLDVVNCSLGTPDSSETVRNWMERARQAGVAVVVAAGNSSGAVQFPATIPGVLAVSAFGKHGAYPEDTYHAQTVPVGVAGSVGVNGIFAPKFTCFGPEIDVCGPGVAIISSVPGGGYAAWDGTSMAAPHITGLIALLAAHHPEFTTKGAPRDSTRVDRLFQIIIGSAARVGLDPRYSGSGVPNTVAALSNETTDGADGQFDINQLTRLIETVVKATVNAPRQGVSIM